MPAPGTAAHEDAEKPVTGDAATKAQAAAVKAIGGGTAGDVTADYFGDGYEVTVTKSDGSTVEVHLDSSFNVMTRPGGWGGGSASPAPRHGSTRVTPSAASTGPAFSTISRHSASGTESAVMKSGEPVK